MVIDVQTILQSMLPTGPTGPTGAGGSGPTGPTGAGTSGFSGYSGISGFSGYSGISGFSGYSGISGYSGAAGPSTTINATNDNTSATQYPVFVAASGSDQTARVDISDFVFNPGTIRLGVGTSVPAATLDVFGSVSIARANVLSQTLTDAASIAWDTSLGQIASVTITANRAMANPTNLRVGTYILYVIQDGVGGRTLTWGSVFKWTSAVAPTLSTAANARDVFSFVSDGTNLYGSMIPDVR